MRANSDREHQSYARAKEPTWLQRRVQRFVSFFFVLAVFAALWSTATARLTERSTAVALLTKAGTDLINPLLIRSGTGIAEGTYVQLQRTAALSPNSTLPLGFLKIPVIGSSIAGKDFTAGSRIIYGQIAEAYYDGGAGAAFALPPELQQIVSTYTPFIQQANINTVVNNAGVTVPTLPQSPLPQVPAVFADLFTSVGVTPNTLTASAHAAAVARSQWLWFVCVALAIIVALLSTGWDRLKNVAWAFFNASWLTALVGIVATVLVARNPAQAAPFRSILDIIGGSFMTVFYWAALAGMLTIIASMVGQHLLKNGALQHNNGNATVDPSYNQPYGSEVNYPPQQQYPSRPEYPPQQYPSRPEYPPQQQYPSRPEYPQQQYPSRPEYPQHEPEYPSQPSTQPLPQQPPPYRYPHDQPPPRQR